MLGCCRKLAGGLTDGRFDLGSHNVQNFLESDNGTITKRSERDYRRQEERRLRWSIVEGSESQQAVRDHKPDVEQAGR